MKRILCYLLFVICSHQQAYTQSNPPLSSVELEARGTWVFWPYKLKDNTPGSTTESTLLFANGNEYARLADSVPFFQTYSSSSSSPAGAKVSLEEIIDQDYIKGVLVVFGWNYLQFDTTATGLGNVPDYSIGGNDLIRYQKFYEAIKAVVNTDNIKGYGLEIWTGHWAPIGDPDNPNFPFWLSTDSADNVKRIAVTKGTETRYFADYLDKGRKVPGQGYVNNFVGTYPNYVKMPTVSSVQTADSVYIDDDYTRFGYTSDNLAETKYEYYYRNFLYRLLQYLCNLPTTGTVTNAWEDTLTSKKIKEKLLFFQFGEGSTGDLRPWDGNAVIDEPVGSDSTVKIDLSDAIDLETEWPIFVRKQWGWLANTLYKLNGPANMANYATRPLPNAHLLLNGGNGSKVWGERSDGSNPGLNKLPRTFNIDFTTPSPESYFLWPVSTYELDSVNNSCTDTQRLFRNWFGRRYQGNSWSNTPDSIMTYLHQSWRKPPEGGHLYNMNFGKQYRDIYRKLKYGQLGSIAKTTQGSNGGVIRYRDECDWNNTDLDTYQPRFNDGVYNFEKLLQRPQHLFATATSALDFGLDYWIQYTGAISYQSQTGDSSFIDTANGKVFTFFNQHVQDYDYSNNDITKTIKSSYLAFKDGLDAGDTLRFATEDLAIHGGNNTLKLLVKSATDNDTINSSSKGEAYAEKIAKVRNSDTTLSLPLIYNQNSLQAKSDIAQGGAGNQYNSNGAGKNDVGWFVTTDNDAAIIKSGGSTKQTMQEVNSTGGIPDAIQKVGYYNIIGTLRQNGVDTTDKLSPFGRFSKGIVSPGMAGNASGAFYQKASATYIKLGDELRSSIYNNNDPKDVYIAITWFGSSVYSGNNDATSHKLNLTIKGSDCTLKTYTNTFNRYSGTIHNRKRWFTSVYQIVNWTVFPNLQSWDFAISNSSGFADVSIQLAMVEIFIGSKPDYITDGLNQTAYYYAYPKPGKSGDPFNDANITGVNMAPPPDICNFLSAPVGDTLKVKTTTTDWQLYPNPAVNYATIRINQSASTIGITIRDMMGKTLHTKSLSSIAAGYNAPIDLSGFAKGVYMITLEADGAVSHKKLVVE